MQYGVIYIKTYLYFNVCLTQHYPCLSEVGPDGHDAVNLTFLIYSDTFFQRVH